jgi:NAD-dependent deacetylase
MKQRLVVFTGAGVSAESGIRTFRDTDGLWEEYRIEEVATPEAWRKDPDLVSHFYNLRRKQVMEAEPNDAHRYFAELEQRFDTRVVTQNIDDLHERAGSSNVLHLHGNIRLAKSSGPNAEKCYYPIGGWELKSTDLCPDGHRLRPHVVWFGEEVPNLEKAARIVSEADILIVVGTSLNVYPAAGLVHYAPRGCRKLIIDPDRNLRMPDSSFVHICASAVDGVRELEDLV